VVHPDGTLQATCRNFPSPIVHFLEASGIWRRLGNSRWMARRLYLVHPHDAVLSPDWLTGVCMLISAEVFRKVGGMNADLSPEMFAEDLEWCWRIRKAGYEIMFDPAATIVHHESASPLDNRAVKTYKSFYRFCASHYSKTFCAGIRLATIMALAPKFLLSRDLEKRTIYAAIMKLPVI
jgi:GT2 family glycosyltransferase